MNTLSIKHKSNGIFITLFVVILLAGILILYSLEKAREDAQIMNELGRQRMLAHEMAQSALAFSMAKNQRKILEQQIQSLDNYITQMRRTYTESVIKKIQNTELEISMDPAALSHSAIPYPATFTRMVNERFGEKGIFSANIISENPVNPKQSLKSDLDKEANAYLQNQGNRFFSKVVEENGKLSIKLYSADRATVPACVSCHSALQNKKVRVGDILGIRSYKLVYSEDIAMGNKELNATLNQYNSTNKRFKQTLKVAKSGGNFQRIQFGNDKVKFQGIRDPGAQNKMMEIEKVLQKLENSVNTFLTLETNSLAYRKARNEIISESNELRNKSEELVLIYQSIAEGNYQNILLAVIVSGLLAFIVLISMARYMTTSIIEPVQKISVTLTEITKGRLRQKYLNVKSADEIGVLNTSCNELIESLQRFINYSGKILSGSKVEKLDVKGEFKVSLEKLELQVAAKRKAEMALREAQVGLEKRVKERTAELFSANKSLKEEIHQRKQMEVQLNHAQKMESIGQLAAGIAHEINTPMQFIGDNTRFLEESFQQILQTIKDYEQVLSHSNNETLSKQIIQDMEASLQDNDIDYLSEEIPLALQQTLDGVNRVTTIVRAMKEFSHPGSEEKIPTDINNAIETTLMVAKNEWKYVADIVKNLDPNIPLVPCFVNDFNQVILNSVVNAAHAIEEKAAGNGDKGTITVSTRQVEDWVQIQIQDTGTGIPEKLKSKVFDPFFTTKEVGKGTGQGLSIVHNVITKKHQGVIDIETEEGKGTTFIFKLPLSSITTSGSTP